MTTTETESLLAQQARRVEVNKLPSRKSWRSYVPTTIALIGLIPIIIIPVILIAYASFSENPPRAGQIDGSLTAQHYGFLFNEITATAFLNTAIIGVGGTSIAMIIGCTLAWLAARTNVIWRWLIQVAGIVPLFISALVGALAWSVIGSPNFGYINLALRAIGLDANLDLNSLGGIVFVLGLYNAPYSFLFSYNAFALMNPDLEEAATTHGGKPWHVARHVTIPMVAPALFSSGILTLILVMENFPVPYVLGQGRIPTLPTLLYQMIATSPTRPGEAGALGLIMVLLVVVLVYVQRRILGKRSFTTITGKGFRPRRIDLKIWRWPAFAFAVVYLLTAVVLPYFALLQSSLRRTSFVPDFATLMDFSGFAFDNYVELWSWKPFTDALVMTAELSIITAVVGALVSFLIAYLIVRTKVPGRSIVDYVTNIPIALPALVIGIGLLWTFLLLPLPIYGTAAALAIAYLARFLPHGYRSMSSTIGQIHPELEESARVSGAGRIKIFSFVMLPLLRTGFISTLLLIFIMCVRELSVSLFLYTAKTRVLSILVFEQFAGGSFPRAAAISIVYSLFLLIITMLGWRYLNGSDRAS